MTSTIRIGTRGSRLAMWQTDYIADLLEQRGVKTEKITFQTKGDRILNLPIPQIGSKGVFTEELEQALRSGQIDVAMHSAKDLQSTLPPDLEIIAFSKREEPHDVILSHQSSFDPQQPGLKIGTSSTRRIALLKNQIPQVQMVDMRGNLQTRIAKMESGICDAIVLAYAGVHRMGYDNMIRQHLDLETFPPAVGQGCIALEASTSLDPEKKVLIQECINDKETEICIRAERSFLRKLEGGCSIPVFGLARMVPDELQLNAGIISLDGSEKIQLTRNQSLTSNPEDLGLAAANELLEAGGDRILEEIRKNL